MSGRQPAPAPLYVRVLRLRHIRPSGTLCFLFFEGAIALGVLLALAELVSWWAVPALPVVVALMVKLNDLIAGALAGRPPAGGAPAEPAVKRLGLALQRLASAAPADPPVLPEPESVFPEPESDRLVPVPDAPQPVAPRQVSRDLSDTLDPADSPQQRFRQSARRRYR